MVDPKHVYVVLFMDAPCPQATSGFAVPIFYTMAAAAPGATCGCTLMYYAIARGSVPAHRTPSP